MDLTGMEWIGVERSGAERTGSEVSGKVLIGVDRNGNAWASLWQIEITSDTHSKRVLG